MRMCTLPVKVVMASTSTSGSAKGEHNCLRVIDAGVCINNQLHFW